MMKIYSLMVSIFIVLINFGCMARIPMKVEDMTYQKYSKIYEKQSSIYKNPLLGIWRVTFAQNEKLSDPNKAYYAIGDTVFVAIIRGANVDFVCTSALSNYGSMSDQGPSFRVNFNGNTFWSFNINSVDKNKYEGIITGMLGSEGKVEAILSEDQTSLIIYEYPELGDGSTEESPRIGTTAMLIGGPIGGSYPAGTIATIFLQRR